MTTTPRTSASNAVSGSSRPTPTRSARTSRRSNEASSTSCSSMQRAFRFWSSKPRPKPRTRWLAKSRPATTPAPKTAASSSSPTAICTTSGTSNAAAHTSSASGLRPSRASNGLRALPARPARANVTAGQGCTGARADRDHLPHTRHANKALAHLERIGVVAELTRKRAGGRATRQRAGFSASSSHSRCVNRPRQRRFTRRSRCRKVSGAHTSASRYTTHSTRRARKEPSKP